MKLLIQEAFYTPDKNDFITLFDGECNTLQFRSYDKNIKKPMWARMLYDGQLLIMYPPSPNIKVVIDKAGTVWLEAATTIEELKKTIAGNELLEVE